MNTSPGRLMHSSVTSGSASSGRSARSVSSSARQLRAGATPGLSAAATARAAHRRCRKSRSRATSTWMRSPLCLMTVGGMLTVSLNTSVRRPGTPTGAYDRPCRPLLADCTAACTRAVDDRDQHARRRSAARNAGRTSPGSPDAPEFVGARRIQWHEHAGRACAPRSTARTRAPSPAAPGRASRRQLRAALEQHHLAVGAEGVGGRDAGRHARQRGVDGGLQRAVDEGALGQQQPLRRQASARGTAAWRRASSNAARLRRSAPQRRRSRVAAPAGRAVSAPRGGTQPGRAAAGWRRARTPPRQSALAGQLGCGLGRRSGTPRGACGARESWARCASGSVGGRRRSASAIGVRGGSGGSMCPSARQRHLALGARWLTRSAALWLRAPGASTCVRVVPGQRAQPEHDSSRPSGEHVARRATAGSTRR